MAKKSAKSKGYRKTVQKKPFLTKKEITLLVVIVAVIAAAVILFNLFYDDGYLRPDDVQPNDLVSFVSRDINNRYVKLGEVGDLEGFTESESELDVPLVTHDYRPDGEQDHIDSISISGNFNSAAQFSNNQANLYRLDDYVFSEVQTGTIQGHDAYIYSVTYDYYSEEAAEGEADAAEQGDEADSSAEGEAAEAPAEDADAADEADAEDEAEPESNVYAQSINCYVDLDDYSVCIYINRSGDGASIYVPDGQLVDYVSNYASAITFTERNAK